MKYLIYLISICLLVVSTACQQAQSSPENIIHVKNSNNDNSKQISSQQIAEHLANLATQVPNVNDATAVVAGDYAIVGIDVDANLERSRVSTIKYTVAESLKKDPYGANAVIVADPDTFTRIKEIGNKIRDGKPIEGIMDELAAIIGRIMPEVPSEIDTEKDIERQNEEQLPMTEGQELEKLKEKQSQSKQERP